MATTVALAVWRRALRSTMHGSLRIAGAAGSNRGISSHGNTWAVRLMSSTSQAIPKPPREQRKKEYWERRASDEMEAASRWGELELPHIEVATMPDKEFLAYRGERRVRAMALRHEIYQTVFRKIFIPRKNAIITFGDDVGLDTTFYRGNLLAASKMQSEPKLRFEPEKDTLFTALLMDADGRMDGRHGQLAHWLVTNISDPSDLSSADTIVPYLPPIPPRNTGYHRLIFALYEQSEQLSTVTLAKDNKTSSSSGGGGGGVGGDESDKAAQALRRRYMECAYLEREHGLSPAGLAFAQVCWDDSVDKTFASSLNMSPPVFA